MYAPREPFMTAAKASLQALYPDRLVERGLQDPALLGDARLRRGVYSLISEETAGWTEFTGREAENGTFNFAIVAWGLLPEDSTPEQLEQHESLLEGELLAWCQAKKPPPLDAVYPRRCTYSRGLEAPLGWLVMSLEALYV
jgi:hypothetical protein